MSEIIQGGSTANKNGKIFEDTLIPTFQNHGYIVIQNRDLEYFNTEENDKYVILNAPFETIYNHKGKTEFLLINKVINKKIRIECKWQQSKGSVDEKFPYLYLNAVKKYQEDDIIILLDGNGYKEGAKEWLENAIETNWENTYNKNIMLMSLNEFIIYFNKELK